MEKQMADNNNDNPSNGKINNGNPDNLKRPRHLHSKSQGAIFHQNHRSNKACYFTSTGESSQSISIHASFATKNRTDSNNISNTVVFNETKNFRRSSSIYESLFISTNNWSNSYNYADNKFWNNNNDNGSNADIAERSGIFVRSCWKVSSCKKSVFGPTKSAFYIVECSDRRTDNNATNYEYRISTTC